ncbi:MAG TPA: hypothetical protein VKT72_11760 [Candidatus Baltobacteraceae bacterium]|nr:hypothetical protein [Candidatus Baltobacteraceae bacterium]
MATILVQTTLSNGAGEWQIDRFSSLVRLLRSEGHAVIARNREPQPDGSDPVLSSLDTSDFDELWLFAADRGNGLAPSDVRGILRFRERGGGIFAARDRENIGVSLLNLGTVGIVNHFHTYNRRLLQRSSRLSVHGVAPEDEFQRIIPLEPVHELLRTPRSRSGVIEYFPTQIDESPLSVSPYAPFARVIAVTANCRTGREANVAIAIDEERGHDGRPCGRAVTTGCLHQFADGRWNGNSGEPSEAFKDFARNVARWLVKSA